MIGVWDTGQASAEPLAATNLTAKDGWIAIPAQETAANFKGDVVLANGRILAVVRKDGSAVEVYSEGLGQPALRLGLVLLAPGGEAATRLERVNLVENSKSGACVEVHRQTAQGSAVAAPQVPDQARGSIPASRTGSRRRPAARRMSGPFRCPPGLLCRRHPDRCRQAPPLGD